MRKPVSKILAFITEDWFTLSHFAPLLRELVSLADEVVLATRSSGRLAEIERLGVRVRPFDFHRGSLSVPKLLHVRAGLLRLINEERPTAIHAVAMQTMIMGSLALARGTHRPSAVMLHLTGLGYLGQGRSPVARLLRPAALAALRHCAATQKVWLLAENDDDAATMVARRIVSQNKVEIIPGAGLDPAHLPEAPPTGNVVPRAAYVGRMLRSKGVDVLVEAHRRLLSRDTPLDLELFGANDPDSRDAISAEKLHAWQQHPRLKWHGRTNDVPAVWRTSDIAVIPALGGDGMPRAMLEAAASGRPLIVSDVPGCRQFVRNGSEGFVVPPGDPESLARALGHLALNPALRTRFGEAARVRFMDGYTNDIVQARIRHAYKRALAVVSNRDASAGTR